jgi:hypothetical protein
MSKTVANPINEIITIGSFNSISTKFITHSKNIDSVNRLDSYYK